MSVMSLMPALAFCAFCLCLDLRRFILVLGGLDALRCDDLVVVGREGRAKGAGVSIKTCSAGSMGVTTSSSSHSSQSSMERRGEEGEAEVTGPN